MTADRPYPNHGASSSRAHVRQESPAYVERGEHVRAGRAHVRLSLQHRKSGALVLRNRLFRREFLERTGFNISYEIVIVLRLD